VASLERAGDVASVAAISAWLERRRAAAFEPADRAATRESLAEEVLWLQLLDREVRVHLDRLAHRIYAGRHPKHWLWRQHKQWVLDRLSPGERVVDIGGGASAYLQWMAELGCDVTVIDFNPARIELASRTLSHQKLRWVCADVTEWMPESRFDVVVCCHMIEHLDDPVGVLRGMTGLASRLLVAVPPEHSRWEKLMYRDLGLPWKDDEDHRREYTAGLLTEQLDAAGWDVVELHDGIDIKACARVRGG